MWRPIALLLGSVLASGCNSLSKECTAIGCGDGANITLRMPDDHWPAGSYELAFTIDGDAHTCALIVPNETSDEPGRVMDLSCEPDFRALLVPTAECTGQRTGQAGSQTQEPNTDCEPIEGGWLLTASFYGVAESLRVTAQRDGTTLLDRTEQLEYEESRPNGPDCEPLCRQANIALTIE